MLKTRKALLALAVLAIATASAFAARAQDYPTRSIQAIVPFACGGASHVGIEPN